MVDEKKQPGRPGRRPKIEGKPKTSTMAFRVREGMREKLQVSADVRGMSLSEEVERRLDLSLDMAPDPFKTIALRMITEQWKIIDTLTQRCLRNDDLLIYADTAKKAVEDTVRLINEPALASKMTSEGIKDFFNGVTRRGLIEANFVNRVDLSEITNNLFEGYREGVEDQANFADIMAEPSPPKQSKAEREERARAAADRKANAAQDHSILTPTEIAEQVGPPGRQYLKQERKPEAEPAARFATPEELAKAVPAENRDPTLSQQADFDEAKAPHRDGYATPPAPVAPPTPAPSRRKVRSSAKV